MSLSSLYYWMPTTEAELWFRNSPGWTAVLSSLPWEKTQDVLIRKFTRAQEQLCKTHLTRVSFLCYPGVAPWRLGWPPSENHLRRLWDTGRRDVFNETLFNKSVLCTSTGVAFWDSGWQPSGNHLRRFWDTGKRSMLNDSSARIKEVHQSPKTWTGRLQT